MGLCPVLAPPSGSQPPATAGSWSPDAGPKPHHKVTHAHEGTWGHPSKDQTNKNDTPNHTPDTHTHTHTLTVDALTRMGPGAPTAGAEAREPQARHAGPSPPGLAGPEQLCRHPESTRAPPLKSHQPKMGLLLADGWLRSPSLHPRPPPLSLLLVLEVRGRGFGHRERFLLRHRRGRLDSPWRLTEGALLGG